MLPRFEVRRDTYPYFYVFDVVRQKRIGGWHRSRMEAELAVERLKRRDALRQTMYDAIETFLDANDGRPALSAPMHLAGAMADLGAIAGALHEGRPSAELEGTITELAGRLVWWLQDINLTR